MRGSTIPTKSGNIVCYICFSDEANIEISNKHKKNVIAIFVLAFLCYRALYSGALKDGLCIRDITHTATAWINDKLNQDGDFAYYFMIIGQLFVDLQIMMFILFQIFKT